MFNVPELEHMYRCKQVQGLCLGTLLGTAVHAASYGCTNWDAEAAKAAERAEVKTELSQLAEAVTPSSPTDLRPSRDEEQGREEGEHDESTSLLNKGRH